MKFNYKENADKAYALHQEGRLDEAEALYLKLISINPDDFNVLNLYGLLLISKQNYDDAVTYLSKAMLYKQDAYIISNLAKAYYLAGEYEKSAKMYKTSLKYDENDDTYYSLALSYKKLNNIKESISAYKKAVEINPSNLNAYYNMILIYSDCGNFKEAIKCGIEACENNNNADEIYTLLSGLYENEGETEKAVFYLEKAVEASPKDYIYYYNLGVLYGKLNRLDKSVENYKKALLINPKHIESYVNIASVYKKNKNYDIALKYIESAYMIDNTEPVSVLLLAQTYKDMGENDKSIKILSDFIEFNNKLLNNCAKRYIKLSNENNIEKREKLYINAEKINKNGAEAYSLIAMNYMDKGEYDTAIKYYDKAIETDNENLSYKHGKAVALKYMGNPDVCKQMLEEILKTGKADEQTKITLGMLYLQKKEMKKGFELYSERNNSTAFVSVFKEKIYKYGEDISGKTVLLYSNCGLGDTIMYSRFFNIIKEKCKTLILQTDSQLVQIMKINFPDIQVIKKSVSPPDFDVAIPVMDLQYFLDINFDELKIVKSYLKADEKLSAFFTREVLKKSNKLKIGLCWQGNKKIFKNRSVSLSYIEKFIKDDRFEYYSFQVDKDTERICGINSLKKYISDYNDTAALLKNIDIMITIDSSIAHMAGALGVKTYLVLPHTAEWRWFDDTEKTIWYDNIKIFKQKQAGDWAEVFERIKTELNNNET